MLSLFLSPGIGRSQVTDITGDGCGAVETRKMVYTNEEDQDNEVSHVDVVSI